jgi:hypothetical protein
VWPPVAQGSWWWCSVQGAVFLAAKDGVLVGVHLGLRPLRGLERSSSLAPQRGRVDTLGH